MSSDSTTHMRILVDDEHRRMIMMWKEGQEDKASFSLASKYYFEGDDEQEEGYYFRNTPIIWRKGELTVTRTDGSSYHPEDEFLQEV